MEGGKGEHGGRQRGTWREAKGNMVGGKGEQGGRQGGRQRSNRSRQKTTRRRANKQRVGNILAHLGSSAKGMAEVYPHNSPTLQVHHVVREVTISNAHHIVADGQGGISTDKVGAKG